MNIVIVESPAKAKTVNKYLGPGYHVIASYGHVRDLPSKNGSVLPDNDFEMHWDVEPKAAKRLDEIAKARQRGEQADPRHRPRPRGRGHLLARPPGARPQEGPWRHTGRAGGVQRRDQRGRARGDAPSARDRRAAGQRLSRPPRARLSGRLHAVPGAVAEIAGRPLGRPGAVGGAPAGLRPRARDREIQGAGILVDPGRTRHRQERDLPARLVVDRRQEAREVRHRRSGDRRTPEGRARRRTLHRLERRKQGAAPQPRRPVHHLDPAAGGLAQARLLAAPHHAARAAPL